MYIKRNKVNIALFYDGQLFGFLNSGFLLSADWNEKKPSEHFHHGLVLKFQNMYIVV